MEERRISYVYVLIDPRNDEIFYVGKGIKNRIKQHVNEAKITAKNSKKLNKIRKILSLGLDVIALKVEENVSDTEAKDFEVLLIAECRDKGIDLCNMTNGGDGSTGCKPSAETRNKISIAQKGVPKNLSDERLQELRDFMSGENNPMKQPEIVAKSAGENHWAFGLVGESNPNFGRKDTLEQIEAKRKRMLGVKTGPCSEERKENIRNATTGVKKSTTINMRKPRSKVVCPYCNKEGGSNTMHRWHFDNCKYKEGKDAG